MKRMILSFLLLLPALAYTQTGIGTTSPDPHAALDISSTQKGVLLPRLNAAQQATLAGILTPAETGMLVTDAGTGKIIYWSGSAFQSPATLNSLTAAAPLSVATNKVSINPGTATGDLITWDGNNWVNMQPARQVYLEWTTALEENADGFEIQQSTDGASYATVAFVKAKGTPSDYQISVPQSVQQAFYRIRQEDLDGAFTYSVVVRVQLSCIVREGSLAVYPNPVHAALNIEARYVAPADRGAAQMLLVDMSGKPVYSHIIAVNKGANVYSIPSTGLGKGIYMLFLIGDGWKTEGVKVLLYE